MYFFLYFQLFFYLLSSYELTVNIYGNSNFVVEKKQKLKIINILNLFKKIFLSKAISSCCFVIRNSTILDIIIFERIPYANISIDGKYFTIDKNGFEINPDLNETKICLFLNDHYQLKKCLLHLKNKHIKNCDYLYFNQNGKYEAFFDGNKLIYYNLAQVDIFHKDILNKIKSYIGNFKVEFYPNQKFRIFLKKTC